MAKKVDNSKTKVAMPEQIFAQVSPKSIGGMSMFDAGEMITADTAEAFASETTVVEIAVERLQRAGFEVLQVTENTINIAGSAATYNEAFNTTLYTDERDVIKPLEGETTATFIDSPSSDLPGLIATKGTRFADVIEGVAIEEPYYYMSAPNASPPPVDYWHLTVPGGVSLGCNADRAHRIGITGKKIRVAMTDTGHYAHPFFKQRGYRVRPVRLAPGTKSPLRDEHGHGTGESANIFAVAPDVTLYPVKTSFVNVTASFNTAVALKPHIITNSWGSNIKNPPLSAAKQTLALAVANACRRGIIVVFSAGNGSWGFPGQHPDVISAGGVYMDANGSLRASDYASGFMSKIYRNRRVPDLCGLVGMSPGAMYIMLPVEAGDVLDVNKHNKGAKHPMRGRASSYGDETAPDDGWAAFSGTSASAPQLAGAAALVKQAYPTATPRMVRDILMDTARDVRVGSASRNTEGNKAKPGVDNATGHGLVDAYKATTVARLRRIRSTFSEETSAPAPQTALLQLPDSQPDPTHAYKNGSNGHKNGQNGQHSPLSDEDFDFLENVALSADTDIQLL